MNDQSVVLEEKFALTSSRQFPEWLASSGASLAFTTYQAGKLFLIGVKPDGRLAVFQRTFPRCMGLGVDANGRSLFLARLGRQLAHLRRVQPQPMPDACGKCHSTNPSDRPESPQAQDGLERSRLQEVGHD